MTFTEIKNEFDAELRRNGMNNGYITLCEDISVLIEGCALSAEQLTTIANATVTARKQNILSMSFKH